MLPVQVHSNHVIVTFPLLVAEKFSPQFSDRSLTYTRDLLLSVALSALFSTHVELIRLNLYLPIYKRLRFLFLMKFISKTNIHAKCQFICLQWGTVILPPMVPIPHTLT